MIRALKGATVGFLAGAVLEFVVVTGLLSAGDPEEDSTQYAWWIALCCSPLAGLIGSLIGVVVGGLTDWRKGGKSPYRLFCLIMGILVFGAGTLGIVLPFTGHSAALPVFVPSHYLETCVGIMVAGLVLCLAARLIPAGDKH